MFENSIYKIYYEFTIYVYLDIQSFIFIRFLNLLNSSKELLGL